MKKKIIWITIYTLLFNAITLFAQEPEKVITLQSNLSGETKNYVARELIQFEPGFSYTATSGTSLSAFIMAEPILSDLNYIYTLTPLTMGTSLEGLTNNPIGDVSEQVTYFDGLGRPSQVVGYRSSPTGKDVVQPIIYDDYGREKRKYLPYTNGDNGAYKSNAINQSNYSSSDQYSFYQNIDDAVDRPYPFSETVFEASPLNRILEQGAPGASWQPGEATIRYGYYTNTDNEVVLWSVNSSNQLVKSGSYSAGQLSVTQITDENSSILKEYKDKQNRVVLKVSAVSTADESKTYYVYDDFGMLRYVLPPMMVQNIGSVTIFSSDNSLVKGYCYYYRYDERKRMVEKQLPGADPIYMVYDNSDRLVLNQDGVHRTTGSWMFTKYDVQGRPIMTGEKVISGMTHADLISAFKNYTGQSYETVTTSGLAYTLNSSYSTSIQIDETDLLTANYYDNYNFRSIVSGCYLIFDSNFSISSYTDNDITNNGYYDLVRGQVTCSRAKVLDGNEHTSSAIWLNSVIYYDDHYRPIQITKNLYPSGLDYIFNRYSFNGSIERTLERQIFNGVATIRNTYMTYDHANRLIRTEQDINGENRTTISEQTYNELEQLSDKQLGGGIQSVDYKYNIRGWLKSINNPDDLTASANGDSYDDLFAMRLLYNDNTSISGLTSTTQFNGNISGIVINRRNSNSGINSTTFGYGFTYDALNRIKSSDYGEGTGFTTNHGKFNEYGLTYDVNGNILTLKRNSTSLVDDLSYTYNNSSNQLLSVTDASSKTVGFKDDITGDDYSYDSNGNLTKDANKGISTISYNILNLPYTLLKDANNSIRYIYNAAGEKLCKEAKVSGTTQKRYYAGGFEYDDSKALAMIHSDDNLVEVSTSGGTTSYSYEYYLKDHLGNTRVLFSSTGGVLQRYDYYPFGATADQFSSSTDNKYLYNSKELQQELDLNWYDYGARFYDPVIGRWHMIDPMTEEPLNICKTPYNYVTNNPLVFIDPNGENWFYYQAKDEKEASWHWAKGNETKYIDTEGDEQTIKSDFEYLVKYTITEIKEDGSSVGRLEIWNQDQKLQFKDKDGNVNDFVNNVFSGGDHKYSPIQEGNYYMDLSERPKASVFYADGGYQLTGIQKGIQKFPKGEVEQNGVRYDVGAEWGTGRIRLNYNGPRRLFLHGKFLPKQWTHGCVCDRSGSIVNYFWNKSDYKGVVPFWVKKQ